MPNVVTTASNTASTALGTVSDTADFVSKGIQSLSNYTDKALYHSQSVSRRAKFQYDVDDTVLQYEARANAVRRATDFTQDLREDLKDENYRKDYERLAHLMFGENLIPDEL